MAPIEIDAAVAAALARVGPGVFGVACSGGADSIALAAAAIRAVGPDHVVVATIDHGLSAGSEERAARVARWARGQGVAAVVRTVAVPRRASLEAAARAARYAALEGIADELGLVAVLVGHTARDQAETVLHRILRGTGPAGLAGMAWRRGRFVRPLLAVGRPAIDAYVRARNLPVLDDPMNDDRRLTRVRLRHEVLPGLRRENPAIDDALVRLAAASAEWLAVIDARARPHSVLPISCAALAAEPPAIRKRALALALEDAGIDYAGDHLDALDALVTRPAHGEVAIDLPGARVVRSYDALDRERAPAPPSALFAPPGHTLRPWAPGDRMRLARLGGRSRKLSDLYGDARVPRALRGQARVLVRTRDHAIVWAEYLGIAHASQVPEFPSDRPVGFEENRLCNQGERPHAKR